MLEKGNNHVPDIKPLCQHCLEQISGTETCSDCTECMLRKPVMRGVSRVQCGCKECILTNQCKDCHNDYVHGIPPPLNGSSVKLVETPRVLPRTMASAGFTRFSKEGPGTLERPLTGVGVGVGDFSQDTDDMDADAFALARLSQED